ncbi:rCG60406 [Rattus norvegicus]|uniref:RCG60406 n=1 Tax=Rattus norvegicus TaxID=10116 RepID=A6KK53_RAT|nr:rCG60406 [Rattus norvegicus]
MKLPNCKLEPASSAIPVYYKASSPQARKYYKCETSSQPLSSFIVQSHKFVFKLLFL